VDDELVEVKKVSVGEVSEVRDQLKQLVRIGVVIMIVIAAVQVWGVVIQHQQGSCGRRVAEALNDRGRFTDEIDNITSKKFELDKKLTNRQLPLSEYNKQIDALTAERERTIKDRDSFKFPSIDDCR
jgi:vacuolar-type H+-ATPase subunit I/STV1